MRDLRDNLRAAIDFAGLTENSHQWLYSKFLPTMNRIAVGPPKERIEEMLALMDSGILDASWGANAYSQHAPNEELMSIQSSQWQEKKTSIHVLIKARLSLHSPENDSSLLIQSLLESGYARLFYNGSFHPSGLEVNHDFNLISKQGEIIQNAWALGIPTEGAKFYTFVVPRPNVNSTALIDSGRAVNKMLSMIHE